MSFTNFPNGVSSFGIPLIGSGGVPPLTGTNGTVYFVDPTNGNDNDPGSWDYPMDTVSAAYAKCTDTAGDIVVLLNDGNTSGTSREDAKITWSKDNTHLIGLCAPTMVGQRARISPTTTMTDVDAVTPYIDVTGHGNIFANFSIFQGNSEDSKSSIGIRVTGSRNYFHNVGIQTGAHANQGDEASVMLQLNGSENTFEKCYIGVDTVARGNNAAWSCVKFGTGSTEQATRNVFRDCIFPCFADDTEGAFIRATAANDTQRWNLFERCIGVNTGTSTLAAAVVWTDTTGICLLKDCAFYGVTDITAADNAYVQVYGIVPGTPVDASLFKAVDIA